MVITHPSSPEFRLFFLEIRSITQESQVVTCSEKSLVKNQKRHPKDGKCDSGLVQDEINRNS